MKLTLQNAELAVATHGTVFFDAELNPVVPEIGQWFCEFDEYGGKLRDEALVEYLGLDTCAVLVDGQIVERPVNWVITEYSEAGRAPHGIVLIRQS